MKEIYQGFEQGPIRPPSEAGSLLIRVTRNCPWNRCTFCPVYKHDRYSKRPLAHVLKDIELIYKYINIFNQHQNGQDTTTRADLIAKIHAQEDFDISAFNAGLNWYYKGMNSVFLQDADSLILRPEILLKILKLIKQCFPQVSRITSYARSKTVNKISDIELRELYKAGLNRIHIGLESGASQVLLNVKKGVTPEQHIEAGLKVKTAGIELSEYVMPGLGGRHLSKQHAQETARVLNQINPDFIRLRSLAIPSGIPLYNSFIDGDFEACSDDEIVAELRWFIEDLQGITGRLESDHILNLFEDLCGKLPEDKELLLGMLNQYFDLPTEEKMIYRVGRRSGLFKGIKDLKNHFLRNSALQTIHRYQINKENIENKIKDMISQFI